MKPEDQQAFEDAYKAYSQATIPELAGCKWTGMQLFKAAIAHRDAQASVINEQMLKALKQLLRCPAIVDGDLNSFDWGCPETAEAVSHAEKAITAAEAHKGQA